MAFIHNLHLVRYPCTIADQRELHFDPDLSFPFTTEDDQDTGDHSYPCADDCIQSGTTTIKFTAANEIEFVDRITEYLITCYDCSEVHINPTDPNKLSFMPTEFDHIYLF